MEGGEGDEKKQQEFSRKGVFFPVSVKVAPLAGQKWGLAAGKCE